jgi:hypothetical protein
MDLVRARLGGVVEHVDAVEAGAPAPHLDEPGPDRVRRRGDVDRVRQLPGRVRQKIVARQRPIVVARFGPAELAAKGGEKSVPDEMRSGPDEPEVTAELLPRLGVGRVDANFELEVRAALAARGHPHRPRYLDVAGIVEGAKRLGVGHVHERDVRVPDLADRGNRALARRIFGEHLKSRLIERGAEIVDPEPAGRALPAFQTIGQGADREECTNERRSREVAVPDGLPNASLRSAQVGPIDFDHARRRDQAVE